MQKRALVRRPGPRLDEGLLTHLERSPVDVELARHQWLGYAAALQAETAPAKRRLARVTTCRCGDPQPVESADEE